MIPKCALNKSYGQYLLQIPHARKVDRIREHEHYSIMRSLFDLVTQRAEPAPQRPGWSWHGFPGTMPSILQGNTKNIEGAAE